MILELDVIVTDFKNWMIKRDKEDHYIMIKESVHQKAITVVNMHPQIRAPKYIKQKLTAKRRNNSNMIKAVDFTTLLSTMDTSSRQGICKEIADMDNTVD